jgi:hypothetical protein
MVGKRTVEMSFKATIRKLTNLPWQDLRDIFTWPSHSTLRVENPNLMIATAQKPTGEVVCYTTCEPIFLVDGFTFNPRTTPLESGQAGIELDAALAREAQNVGIGRFIVVIPRETPTQPGERCIRIIEREVPQIASVNGVGCHSPSHGAYLN